MKTWSAGVAIVGCGWAGRRHATAFEACGAEVRWAIDVDRGRSVSVARSLRSPARPASDYQQALADPQVDVVDVCLPHALHAPVTVEAADAGKHVLCEKPMATSLDEADRMVEAAERAGVVLMIAENVRFDPLLQRVQNLLSGGAIGRPALIQITREAYLTDSFLDDRRWFLDAQMAAGGIMMSGGIHDVETARMLLGEIGTVYATRARQRFHEMEGDDTSVAVLSFQGGAIGVLIESFVMKSLATATGSEVHRLRLDGDLGSLSVDDGQTIRLYSEKGNAAPGEPRGESRIHVPPADTFRLEIEHFLQAIRTGQEPLTSGRSQRRALEIVLAAYRSMATGLPVAVPASRP